MERKHWTKRRIISQGLVLLVVLAAPVVYGVTATEAPAGFDNLTNGFEDQTSMDTDRGDFDQVEQIADGLGPVYNTQACRECHQNPVSGTISQITEQRAGTLNGSSSFTPHPGGSLIFSRAIDASIQVRQFGTDNVFTFRTSLNIAGDGFVEALPDSFFLNTQNSQANLGIGISGAILNVPVLESPGTNRFGRFGWKDQHASLLSFSSDAYLNEMGITNVLNPTENTSNGNDVTRFNTANGVAAIQDPATAQNPFGHDVESFARFMRSLKVPPRDAVVAATSDSVTGGQLFNAIGCNICHVTSATTAAAGTSFNGGKFIVPAALGSKIIHPFGDFLLHDIGTSDGIQQNGPIQTAFLMRTAPLWGVRTRNRLMHDGENVLRNDAILRHNNQANPVINNYINLSTNQKNQLITFLNSL